MSEKELKLKVKINGEEAELSIKSADIEVLYDRYLEHRRAAEQEKADEMVYKAAKIAIEVGKISTSLLQRRLSIGYGRAASIVDSLEEMGVIGPAPGGSRPRPVLMKSIDELK